MIYVICYSLFVSNLDYIILAIQVIAIGLILMELLYIKTKKIKYDKYFLYDCMFTIIPCLGFIINKI